MNIHKLSSILFALLLSIFAYSQKEKLDKGFYAKIITEKGEILLELFEKDAPLTVANFIGLAEGNLKVFDSIKHKEPFYNGISFHRVIPNFMIQGGDPDGNGQGGPGYKFFDETDNGIPHDAAGILSMANAGPNTNGSQFFITHGPTPHLNGKHTVFGKVVDGQDVVDAIQQGDKMLEVKIIRKGLKNKLFYNPSKKFKSTYKVLEVEAIKEAEKRAKLEAQNKVRLIEAKGKTKPEYKVYFHDMIKEMYPNAHQTESGLMYLIEEEGQGETPEKGDGVSLHYTGTFVFGEKFDSSVDRGTPLNFDYLVMGLIPGFNEGVGLSKEGMKIKLFIPYYLAYGEKGRMPNMPPYSDLIFDLEILKINKK